MAHTGSLFSLVSGCPADFRGDSHCLLFLSLPMCTCRPLPSRLCRARPRAEQLTCPGGKVPLAQPIRSRGSGNRADVISVRIERSQRNWRWPQGAPGSPWEARPGGWPSFPRLLSHLPSSSDFRNQPAEHRCWPESRCASSAQIHLKQESQTQIQIVTHVEGLAAGVSNPLSQRNAHHNRNRETDRNPGHSQVLAILESGS